MTNGWEVIRQRNERKAQAEANRKPAVATDAETGTERFAPDEFKHTRSFAERVLDADEIAALTGSEGRD